jgi:formylglycine-generating enzyme required for sulfatase activity
LQIEKNVAVVAPPAPPLPSVGVTPAVGIYPETRGVYPLTAEKERGLKPKDSFKECDACPEMVVVPAGQVIMGVPKQEMSSIFERPQTKVTIGKHFAVGRYAVTFDEWDACVADGGCNGYKPGDENWGRGKRPVINVSWHDAKSYVGWISQKTGKEYRLLSEAEREYATRAGTTTPFWWGASISTRQANYDGQAFGKGGKDGENRRQTVPVDSFQPNPFGLYQVHGNVSDWVEDCAQANPLSPSGYEGFPVDGSAWTRGDCTKRVVKGGSWLDRAGSAQARSAGTYPADDRFFTRGFRLGRTLTP